MEALIRWQKSDELILPGEFIYAAEDSDLIIPMTEWVLHTACKQNKLWQKKGLPDISVAINLSINNLNSRLLEVVEQADEIFENDGTIPPRKKPVDMISSYNRYSKSRFKVISYSV